MPFLVGARGAVGYYAATLRLAEAPAAPKGALGGGLMLAAADVVLMASLRRRIKQPTQNPTPTLAAIRTSSHNAGRPTATMAAASTLTIQVSNVKRPSVDTRHSDRLHSPSSTLRLFAL
jgi:acyl-coenzyme A thioesterase PaaI-like protein